MKTKMNVCAWLALGLCAGGLTIAANAKDKENNTWTETLSYPDEQFNDAGRNTYFILEPGYQLTLKGKATELVITVLEDTQDVNGVKTRVVEERETAGGKLVEVSRNFFAVGEKTKNLYYFGEEVDVYKKDGMVVHEGAWREGQGNAKHGILVPGTIKVGDRYYQERAPKVAMDRAEIVSIEETVKTPAGELKHCLKTKETSLIESGTEYKYYAPGIGLVQDGNLKLVKCGVVRK